MRICLKDGQANFAGDVRKRIYEELWGQGSAGPPPTPASPPAKAHGSCCSALQHDELCPRSKLHLYLSLAVVGTAGSTPQRLFFLLLSQRNDASGRQPCVRWGWVWWWWWSHFAHHIWWQNVTRVGALCAGAKLCASSALMFSPGESGFLSFLNPGTLKAFQ